MKQLVDVGGGNGHLISVISSRYPHIHTVLLERPSAIKAALAHENPYIADTMLLEGNFFEQIPHGADLYILRHVLHDWNNKQCREILSNCAKAMRSGSRLLIIEALIGSAESHVPAVWDDLDMLLITGGRARSLDQYSTLCRDVGLQLRKLIHSGEPSITIMEIDRP